MPQNASHISRKRIFFGSMILLCMLGVMIVGCKTQKEAVKTDCTNTELKLSLKDSVYITEVLKGGWKPVVNNDSLRMPREVHFGLFKNSDFGITTFTSETFYAEQYSVSAQQNKTLVICNCGSNEYSFIYEKDSLFCLHNGKKICYNKYADPDKLKDYDLQIKSMSAVTDSLSHELDGEWELVEERDFIANRQPSLIVKDCMALENRQTYTFSCKNGEYVLHQNGEPTEKGEYEVLLFTIPSNNKEFYVLRLSNSKSNKSQEFAFSISNKQLELKGKPYGYDNDRFAFIYRKHNGRTSNTYQEE